MSTLSDDGFATFYNPAALTLNPRVSLGVGFTGIVSQLDLAGGTADDAAGLSEAAEQARYSGLTFAATLPLHRVFRELRRELTIGVAVGLPGGGAGLGESQIVGDRQPFMPVLGAWSERTVVHVGIGGELVPGRLSAGISMIALADTEGHMLTSAAGKSFSESTETSIALSAGLLYRPSDWLAIALVFRDEQAVHISQTLDNPLLAGGETHFEGTPFLSPRTFLLGVSGKPVPWMTVAVDAAFLQSSRFEVESPVVGDGTPTAHDVVVGRLGLEFVELWDVLSVRVGYSYVPRMLDGGQVTTTLLDVNRHSIAGGVAVTVGPADSREGRALRIGAHFQATLVADETFGTLIGPIRQSGSLVGGGLSATFMF